MKVLTVFRLICVGISSVFSGCTPLQPGAKNVAGTMWWPSEVLPKGEKSNRWSQIWEFGANDSPNPGSAYGKLHYSVYMNPSYMYCKDGDWRQDGDKIHVRTNLEGPPRYPLFEADGIVYRNTMRGEARDSDGRIFKWSAEPFPEKDYLIIGR